MNDTRADIMPVSATVSGGKMRLLLVVFAVGLLAGCSSSFGGGGGPPPARTYIILPNGQEVPAVTPPAE